MQDLLLLKPPPRIQDLFNTSSMLGAFICGAIMISHQRRLSFAQSHRQLVDGRDKIQPQEFPLLKLTLGPLPCANLLS